MEMVTGKRPTDPMFKDGLDIVNFVDKNFPDQILSVVEDNLAEEQTDFARANTQTENAVCQCIVSVLQIALSCTNALPSERMNMKEVATRMNAIKTTYLGRTTKKMFD